MYDSALDDQRAIQLAKSYSSFESFSRPANYVWFLWHRYDESGSIMPDNLLLRDGSFPVALVGYGSKYGSAGQYFEVHNNTGEVFDVTNNATLLTRYGFK